MNIVILDPFYEQSHKAWAQGFQEHSKHNIEILSLSPHHWKWRMAGGAVELAEQYKSVQDAPDLIIATDMLDLSTFVSLANIDRSKTSIAIYFHENQITYPWNNANSEIQKEKNHHYGFINFTSCLVADKVFFNSRFHKEDFLDALPGFLKIFPNFAYQKQVDLIANKSHLLPLGVTLPETKIVKTDTPCFLWNHRWEHDKNPVLFFQTLYRLREQNIKFELIVLGKSYHRKPEIFEQARELLSDEIIQFGFVESESRYQELMQRANLLLVTSNQDFFGISIVEAVATGLYPILPDRLAYPEHIPPERHQEFFYQEDDQIVPKLIDIISNQKYLEPTALPSFVQQYAWKNIISQYDDQCIALKKTYI